MSANKWMVRFTDFDGNRVRAIFRMKREANEFRAAHGIKATASRVDY